MGGTFQLTGNVLLLNEGSDYVFLIILSSVCILYTVISQCYKFPINWKITKIIKSIIS